MMGLKIGHEIMIYDGNVETGLPALENWVLESKESMQHTQIDRYIEGRMQAALS